MKGSPILATAIACTIMLSMYLLMKTTLGANTPTPQKLTHPIPSNTKTKTTASSAAHLEIFFSKPPTSFSLTHPATNTTILEVKKILHSADWSGEISLPINKLTTSDVEILVKAQWATPAPHYHFIQVTISPDDLDPLTKSIRSENNISDIMNFQWKEEE